MTTSLFYYIAHKSVLYQSRKTKISGTVLKLSPAVFKTFKILRNVIIYASIYKITHSKHLACMSEQQPLKF